MQLVSKRCYDLAVWLSPRFHPHLGTEVWHWGVQNAGVPSAWQLLLAQSSQDKRDMATLGLGLPVTAVPGKGHSLCWDPAAGLAVSQRF